MYIYAQLPPKVKEHRPKVLFKVVQICLLTILHKISVITKKVKDL